MLHNIIVYIEVEKLTLVKYLIVKKTKFFPPHYLRFEFCFVFFSLDMHWRCFNGFQFGISHIFILLIVYLLLLGKQKKQLFFLFYLFTEVFQLIFLCSPDCLAFCFRWIMTTLTFLSTVSFFCAFGMWKAKYKLSLFFLLS